MHILADRGVARDQPGEQPKRRRHRAGSGGARALLSRLDEPRDRSLHFPPFDVLAGNSDNITRNYSGAGAAPPFRAPTKTDRIGPGQDYLTAQRFSRSFTKEVPMEYAIQFNRLVKLGMEGSLG